MVSNQSERKMALLHFHAALSIFVVMGTRSILELRTYTNKMNTCNTLYIQFSISFYNEEGLSSK